MKLSMKKKFVALLLAGMVFFLIAGCDSKEVEDDGKFKVTFIATESGLGDRSFNDTTWEGIQRAEKELGVEISLIEPKGVADYGTSIVTAVNSGSDLIIAFGGAMNDALSEYGVKYPDVNFGGMNVTVELDNLQVARTSDHEGSFLAGALAALMTKTNTIGGLGGKEIDSILRFMVGYEEGAKYINPDIDVLISYVGAFNDPAKGKDFSLQLVNEDADVIFHAAGGTGEGVFEAVKESENIYAIGVDSDQDYIAQGKILSSMMKKCDNIAYEMIKSSMDGTFVTGNVVYGLSTKSVGLSEMQYTKDLVGEEKIGKLKEIEEKIISGEIKVTDVFDK